MSDPRQNEQVVRLLRAVVILMSEALSATEGAPKPEPLLHRAGLGHSEIAELLDKNPDAVRMAISRAKKETS